MIDQVDVSFSQASGKARSSCTGPRNATAARNRSAPVGSSATIAGTSSHCSPQRTPFVAQRRAASSLAVPLSVASAPSQPDHARYSASASAAVGLRVSPATTARLIWIDLSAPSCSMAAAVPVNSPRR